MSNPKLALVGYGEMGKMPGPVNARTVSEGASSMNMGFVVDPEVFE